MTKDINAVRDMLTDLSGKTALVTGGARGQGSVEAHLLAACGAKVLIGDVLEEEGKAFVAELAQEGLHVRFIRLDVSSEADWDAAVQSLRDWTGRLDILVNNAGIINRTLICATSLEKWNRLISINLTGSFLGIQRCAELMKQSGGGSIINISSNTAHSGHYDPAYTSSKWALRGLTRSAAMEFATDKIRVNAVCPGLIVTELNRNSPHLRPNIEQTPMKRSGTEEEVAQLVLWLASDASTFVTGEDILIDGGFIAGGYRKVAELTGILPA